MPVIVIVVAGAAANFGGVPVQQRHNGVIGQPPALDAEIVNHISQTKVPHVREYNTGPGGLRQMCGSLSKCSMDLMRASARCFAASRPPQKFSVSWTRRSAITRSRAATLATRPAWRCAKASLTAWKAHCWARWRYGNWDIRRELAMSYFEHYYNPAGDKTLRAYSRPVNLTRFDRGIRWSETFEEVWAIPEYLCEIPHTSILTPAMDAVWAAWIHPCTTPGALEESVNLFST